MATSPPVIGERVSLAGSKQPARLPQLPPDGIEQRPRSFSLPDENKLRMASCHVQRPAELLKWPPLERQYRF